MTVKVLSRLSTTFINELSVLESKALVASSNISNSTLLYKALAIPIRCLCPPDNLMPLSPIISLYPNSLLSIKSCN